MRKTPLRTLLFAAILASPAVASEESFQDRAYDMAVKGLHDMKGASGEDAFDIKSLVDDNDNTITPAMRASMNAIKLASEEAKKKGHSDALSVLGFTEDQYADIQKDASGSADRPDLIPGDEWVDILVSRSLSESEIDQLIQNLHAIDFPTRIVYRGIGKGQRLNDAFAEFGRLMSRYDKPVNAVIDPTVFSDHGVEAVPYMMYRKRDVEFPVASVAGLYNPTWLIERVEKGETGHMGTQGPVEEIEERDLIEEMQERMANLDLEEQKTKTIETFWQRATFEHLPRAKNTMTRMVDPRVRVQSDVQDGKGNVITPAGTIINPLDLMTFNMRLIVLNPNIEDEVKWLANLEQAPNGIRDIIMFTEADRERAWKQIEELSEKVKRPIYQLTPDVRERFKIKMTPSVVTADKAFFIVHEIGQGDL
jgi:conjugal transfer pilus assembly protein TraW